MNRSILGQMFRYDQPFDPFPILLRLDDDVDLLVRVESPLSSRRF